MLQIKFSINHVSTDWKIEGKSASSNYGKLIFNYILNFYIWKGHRFCRSTEFNFTYDMIIESSCWGTRLALLCSKALHKHQIPWNIGRDHVDQA